MIVFNKSLCDKDKNVSSARTPILRSHKVGVTKKITKINKDFLKALGYKV